MRVLPPYVSPRPFFAALPGAVRHDDGTIAAPCPRCGRGAATMDDRNIIECSHGCSHGMVTRVLFAPPRRRGAR